MKVATRPPRQAGRKKAGRNAIPSMKYFGTEFVLNTATGAFYRVTPTAILLLKAMEGGADSKALVALIQGQCGVDRTTAVRDVELLLNELTVRGILTS